MSIRRPIQVLSPEVARKIAAGEVIDRPNAIIRELLDNAVDSGADEIDVEIEEGGIEKIRVKDNGSGLTKDDLANCAHPHATSKIASETDLLNLSTLGFRGEALASIAAVSRLSIISGQWKMRASVTEDHIIEPASPIQGTAVTSEGLFENFPARRMFLKRPASEGNLCRTTFIEKALARPDIGFRFTSNGELRHNLRKGQSLKTRFITALEINQSEDLFSQVEGKAPDGTWSFKLIIGDTSVSRNDRKDIYIYVNGRRINEYSLIQAIEYGCQGFFPNGTHPVASLFVEIRPDLIDFNIHPAKKEARFKDISSLHHGVSSTVRNYFKSLTVTQMKSGFAEEAEGQDLAQLALSSSIQMRGIYEAQLSHAPSRMVQMTKVSDIQGAGSLSSRKAGFSRESFFSRPDIPTPSVKQTQSDIAPSSDIPAHSNIPAQQEKSYDFRYIGCALGTFIIVEKACALYLIDQHAAHERNIFDKIIDERGGGQKLLVPYVIEAESQEDDEYMGSIADELTSFGFECERTGDFKWEIKSVNSRWTGSEREFKSILFEKHYEPKEIIRAIAAQTACKAAVKDGYKLDEAAAKEIAQMAFELPDPHCPHGRPVYTVITKEMLFSLVKRT